MPSDHEAWSQTLKAKVNRLQELVLRYLTRKEDTVAAEITTEISGLKTMFVQETMPSAIGLLESRLERFRGDKNSTDHFRFLLQAYQALPSISRFDGEEPSSFEAIFAEHKKDGELQTLFDQLVELLQRIVDEGGEELNAQIERELRVFLEQLRSRDRKSLTELNCWVDLLVRTLFTAAQHYSGVPGLALLWDAAKLAARAHGKLLDSYAEAQKKLTAEHRLKLTAKAAASLPHTPSEQQVEELQAASQKQLHAPTDNPSIPPS